MNYFNENAFSILAEACETDETAADLVEDTEEEIVKDIEDEHDVEEVPEEELEAPAESVPVCQSENSYYIDYGDMLKFAECSFEDECGDSSDPEEFCDHVAKCFGDVCSANGIDPSDTYLILDCDENLSESVDMYMTIIKESKNPAKKKKAKKKLVNVNITIKGLKNKGIKFKKKKKKNK